MKRFIIKHIDGRKPQLKRIESKVASNKNQKKNKNMTTNEKVALAQSVLNNDAPIATKRIKKEKGLIERTESSKTILTEDNKELLID